MKNRERDRQRERERKKGKEVEQQGCRDRSFCRDEEKISVSKEMYQLDATIYYAFILINSLHMFRTFTCPSSGVLIYRLFTAACSVMPQVLWLWSYGVGVQSMCTVCKFVSKNITLLGHQVSPARPSDSSNVIITQMKHFEL